MLVGMLQSVVRAGVTEGLRAPCAAAPLRHPTSGGRALDRQPIKTEAVRMNGLLALGVIVAGALTKQTLGSAFTIMPRGLPGAALKDISKRLNASLERCQR